MSSALTSAVNRASRQDLETVRCGGPCFPGIQGFSGSYSTQSSSFTLAEAWSLLMREGRARDEAAAVRCSRPGPATRPGRPMAAGLLARMPWHWNPIDDLLLGLVKGAEPKYSCGAPGCPLREP